MARSLTRKLIESHLASGKPVAGEEIGLAVDQALLTDTNGTMAWLQFEAMGFPRVLPPCVVTYIDHNVYQVDSRNSDDHRYLQTAARRYGAIFSKPGNGICHQLHLESFSVPGQTLLGTASHTPLCAASCIGSRDALRRRRTIPASTTFASSSTSPWSRRASCWPARPTAWCPSERSRGRRLSR